MPRLPLRLAAWIAGVIFVCGSAMAQVPGAILLVARPGLQDPNFRETVVLVTRTPEGQTLGVILNRPTGVALRDVAPDGIETVHYRDRIFFGGPVLRRSLVALFASAERPAAPAFEVAPGIYLSMHPDNLRTLLGAPPASPERTLRLYLGFAGWAPGQLEAEIAREGWFVLPATEDVMFRKEAENLWNELVGRGGMSKTKAIY